jgi:hypothetical protein
VRALPLLVLLTACVPSGKYPYVALVDQRSFAPDGAAPNPASVRSLPPIPLAIIRFGASAPDYTQALSAAVVQAQQRKPDVEFNVVSAVAPGKSTDAVTGRDATDVARAIAEQAVPAERIHIGVIEDAGAETREVRVYMR